MPQVDSANQKIHVRIDSALFGQCLEQARLPSLFTVTFGDGHMPALVKEHIPQSPRITERALLWGPFRGNPYPAIHAPDLNRRVIRRLNDDFMALPLVRDAPKGHADAMAAISNQSKRLDRLVLNGVGNPFVQRHHQIVFWLASERMGEPEWRG